MKRSGLISAIILAAIIVIAGLAWVLASKNSTQNETNTPASQQQAQTENTQPSNNQNESAATTITYDNSGFHPSSVTVKSGTKVTFKNGSSSTIQVDSDPHPEHTDNTELNVGTISPGSTGSATLTTKGTWGIHNHLDASMRGTIVVE